MLQKHLFQRSVLGQGKEDARVAYNICKSQDFSISDPTPCKCLWKNIREWLGCLGPYSHVGNSEEAPGSWLQAGPAPAFEEICGVNQEMAALSLSLSLILPFR